jgi:uncharacterized protein (DUF849 family)
MAPEEDFTEAMHKPSLEQRPVEAIISRNMVKRAVWVAPILILVFGITSGVQGAVAAGIGVAIVIANFLIGGWILATAAGVSLSLYHAAALFGFFIRLGLITLTMLLVAGVTDIDRVAMGVSAVVSYLTLLSLEAVAITKGAERELEWTN